MNALVKFVLTGLLLGLLSACSLFETDNTEPPAELVDIDTTLKVSRAWSQDTGSGTRKRYLKLHPFLQEGTLYVANANGRVGAYDAQSGKEVWQVSTRLPITGGVNGGEGLLVVGTGQGEAVALRAENGQELWRTRVSSEVMAVSAIDLGVVVVRTNDGKLHALGAGSGELLWQAQRNTPRLSLRGVGVPLVTSGMLINGFDNGKVVALSLSRGTVVWEAVVAAPSGRSELERMVDVDGQIVVSEGIVYAASFQGRVAAINLRDGRVIWERDFSSYAGLSVDRRHVYVSDDLSSVWALDRDSGAPLWKQDKLRLRGVTAPVVLGDYVAVADFEGYVHWMSREDGHFVARTRADGRGVLAPPVVSGNRVFIVGKGGRLSAFEI